MENTRILIVEDDYSAANYLKDMLTDVGYSVVDIKTTGEDAYDFIKDFPVDIVLMDIELEGKLDGIETVKKIKDISNAYIIYITALSDKTTFTRAKATFPKYFISKPFNKHQLLDIIDQTINDCNKILNNISFIENYFFAKTKGIYKKYASNNIKYLQASGSSTNILFKDKSKITLSKNLKNTLAHINVNNILRVNRSYAINIDEIESFDNWHIKLYNRKESIFIQDSFRESFNTIFKKI